MMKNVQFQKCLAVICLLAAGLTSTVATADWIYNPEKSKYRQKYGDFPPVDIDQQLLKNQYHDETPETGASEENSLSGGAASGQTGSAQSNAKPATAASSTAISPATSAAVPPAAATLTPQVPGYGAYYQGWNAYPYNNRRYYRGARFGGPWNNRRSGFSSPWNSNGSNFSGPWNGRGSSFSMPWNNNGSSFSSPWNNNGSSFKPWGN